MPSIELGKEDFDYEKRLEEEIPPTKLEIATREKVFKTKIDLIEEEEYSPPAWGENFKGGAEAINTLGRPPKLRHLEKKTNRQIREQELLSLTRKLKPHVTKAIQAAVKIIDNPEANDANKLKASALLIQTYRQLLLDVFDKAYDSDEGTEVNENAPIFSLRVLDEKKEDGENEQEPQTDE